MRRLTIAILLVFLLAPVASAQPKAPIGGSRWVPVGDVTVTNGAGGVSVRLADQTRVALVCTNNDPAVHVRVGGSGANAPAAASGVELRAGNSITITSTADVRMISEGANVVVSCTEELR